MTLSLFTGFGGADAVAAETVQARNAARSLEERDAATAASKENWEGAVVSMPLVMSQSNLVFTGDNGEMEIQAGMTDVWYLGVLSPEEYASLFPVTLDLDKAEYLTRDLREYIKGISESDRLSLRPQAEAKLNMKRQFVWEASMDDKDYSDKLSIEGKNWTLYEATETSAPSMVCTALVTWVGEKPTQSAPDSLVPSQGDGQLSAEDLMNGAQGSLTGLKDITQESQEVQDFLWELYKEGGLIQSKSDYDLTPFEERAKAEGLTVGGEETTLDVDTLLQQDGATASAAVTEDGSAFNLMTPSQSQTEKEQQTAAPEETGAAESVAPGDAGAAESASPEAAGPDGKAEEDVEAIPEDKVPLAPAPGEDDKDSNADETAGTEETTNVTGDGEDSGEEAASDFESLGLPYAYFGVHMRSNESIATYGAALYFPSMADTASLDDEEPKSEPDPDAEQKANEPEQAAPTMEDKMGEIAAAFNGHDQGPNAQTTYHIRTFSKMKEVVDGVERIVPATYPVRDKLTALFKVGGGNLDNGYSIGVLDDRVAAYDEESGNLIMNTEGRTAVYISGQNNAGVQISRVVTLEVRDIYHLSSLDENEPDVKRAVPMVSSGQYHSLPDGGRNGLRLGRRHQRRPGRGRRLCGHSPAHLCKS